MEHFHTGNGIFHYDWKKVGEGNLVLLIPNTEAHRHDVRVLNEEIAQSCTWSIFIRDTAYFIMIGKRLVKVISIAYSKHGSSKI